MKRLILLVFLSLFASGSVANAQDTSEQNNPRPLVVMLYQEGPDGAAFGAGIVIAQDAQRTIIATAAHNLYANGDFFSELGPQPVDLEFFSRRGERFRATPLSKVANIELDLALIAVENQPRVPRFDETAFAILAEPSNGSGVASLMGQPQGMNWEIFTGARILQPDINYMRIQTPSAAVVPGMSGGALLDDSNAIAGMIVDTEGAVGRAIPIQNIIAFARSYGLESDLIPASQRPDRRILQETSAPDVTSISVSSGLKLRLSVEAASRSQYNARTQQVTERKLPGELFVYLIDAQGDIFDLGQNLSAGRHEVQLRAPVMFVDHCGITAVPDNSGRFVYSRGRYAADSDYIGDIPEPVTNQLTTNPDICRRPARSLAKMTRPFGPISTTYLPLRMFHVYTVIPKTLAATLVGLSPWGGEQAEETGVDSGKVSFFKSDGSRWSRLLDLTDDVYLEGMFSKQNLQVPTKGFLDGSIAACAVRSRGGETFAGLTLFQGHKIPNRPLRKSTISSATTSSERMDPTRFFHVPGKKPCQEALAYVTGR